MSRKQLTSEQIQKMKTLYNDRSLGYTYKRLSVEFGVSITTIQYHLSPMYKALYKTRAKKYAKSYYQKNRDSILKKNKLKLIRESA